MFSSLRSIYYWVQITYLHLLDLHENFLAVSKEVKIHVNISLECLLAIKRTFMWHLYMSSKAS